jgi:DNA uptake protein ComE-like DNA-binding protein
VTVALVAAGWESLEKLKTATVEDLVKVPGIGKARAAAILDEVRGA